MNPSSFPLLPQFLLFVFGVYLSFPTDWFSLGIGLTLALVTLLYFAFQPLVFPQPPHWELLFIVGSWLRKNRPKANRETLQSIHYNQRPKYFVIYLEQQLRPTAYYDHYTIQIKM